MPLRAQYAHTNLVAYNWERLARFYSEVFGCESIPPERDYSGPVLERATGLPDARLTGVHLRLPGWGAAGPTLEIFQYSEAAAGGPAALNRPGFTHLAFAVEDVVAAREAVLAAGGAEVGELSVFETADGRQVTMQYLADPEGNIVEVQRWADAQS